MAGVAIVLVAASLFGTLGPLARFAYDAGMEPLAFVAWRAAGGFLATAAFVAWRIRRGGRRLIRLRDLDAGARLSLAVAAVMGFTLNLGMFMAFDRITVALALLGFYTYPVLVAVGSALLGRELLDRARVAALALAVVGMTAVVAAQLDPAAGIRFDLGGIALAFGAAASQAVYVILSRRGYQVVPADQAIGLVLGVTVICSTVLAIATGALATIALPLEVPSLLPLLLFTGLCAAAIPSILFLKGIRLLGGTGAGIVMLFEPVVGVVLAAWLLAEGLAPIQVLGGLAILGAALILQRGSRPSERVVAAPAVGGDPTDSDELASGAPGAPGADLPSSGALAASSGAVPPSMPRHGSREAS